MEFPIAPPPSRTSSRPNGYGLPGTREDAGPPHAAPPRHGPQQTTCPAKQRQLATREVAATAEPQAREARTHARSNPGQGRALTTRQGHQARGRSQRQAGG